MKYNNNIDLQWDQLSESEKHHFFKEEEKMQQHLLSSPVYARAIAILRLSETLGASEGRDRKTIEFTLLFRNNVLMMLTSIRRCVFAYHRFFKMRNAAHIYECADMLYRLSITAQGLSGIRGRNLHAIRSEVEKFREEFSRWMEGS